MNSDKMELSQDIMQAVAQRVKNPSEGPADGIHVGMTAARVKFRGNGENKKIFRKQETELTVRASLSLGIFSITDEKMDMQYVMSIEAVAAFLNEALRAGMEAAGNPEEIAKGGGRYGV